MRLIETLDLDSPAGDAVRKVKAQHDILCKGDLRSRAAV